ncbi:class I SAM-dependent methyltransferase [Nocardioides panzhihuensis]|uniref:Ubiquinone/menaquinone biosynthesis C-methylase UbiE n=1 Tax=Nocardioides panzhihuensis TaxID=860243 RepID=A0A7Z0DSW3_9ACTN|nr:methyltransferase domain-containing protein [Nocardioides panzhihuensis]NYI81038.1 ubiquinone/menaquinone biosynthesis C-methylase UbiE [Nocardioides panzhihuensis]
MTTIQIIDGRAEGEQDRPFLPGMGRTWLLPLYDLFTRFARVRPLHERTVELAGISSGQTVLDVGCGTGNLAFTVLRAVPDAVVTGHDPDASALRMAARKASRRGVRLSLVQGYADRLLPEDGSVDHIVSSLALHHVDDAGRQGFGREAHRILKPGGRVTIVDFGAPDHGPGHEHEHGHRHGRSRQARPPVAGIVDLLIEAGFADAHEVDHIDHRFGPITIVQATRAAG